MYLPSRFAAALLALTLVVSHASADGIVAASTKQSLRKSPIVQAVNKTKNSIVTIRVARPGGGKDLLGTGVIFHQDGLIVTNRHVVGSNAHVNVILADRTQLTGLVYKIEPRFDLAIVQIDAGRKLPALALATASDLDVGETVIAIGHPFGYENTVSTGIVSAKDRSITMPTGDTITGLIQTDASINPGNSGGPLLNIDGELIGINVALREGAQGIAFAINADMVSEVLSRHVRFQTVSDVQLPLGRGQHALAGSSQNVNGAGVGVSVGGR
jgi:serine protease Do